MLAVLQQRYHGLLTFLETVSGENADLRKEIIALEDEILDCRNVAYHTCSKPSP